MWKFGYLQITRMKSGCCKSRGKGYAVWKMLFSALTFPWQWLGSKRMMYHNWLHVVISHCNCRQFSFSLFTNNLDTMPFDVSYKIFFLDVNSKCHIVETVPLKNTMEGPQLQCVTIFQKIFFFPLIRDTKWNKNDKKKKESLGSWV